MGRAKDTGGFNTRTIIGTDDGNNHETKKKPLAQTFPKLNAMCLTGEMFAATVCSWLTD